jgi:dimethylamine corrinoid protein
LSSTDLAQALGDLQEDEVITGVDARLAAGTDPTAILAEVQRGMEIVGKRFEDGEYYLSELLFAADIFKKVNGPLSEKLSGRETEKLATMVLGTVKNDIHEFGKDIVATILRSNGVEVVDLGIDVEHEAFVAAIRDNEPQFVGLSCMLTTVFGEMRNTIAAIEEAGLRDDVEIFIGGGPVDESLAEHVGADLYCRTAQDAVVAIKQRLGVS